jgi:hypothetical protein
MRRLVLLLPLLLLMPGSPAGAWGTGGTDASGTAKPARTAPQGPAPAKFAPDFPSLKDSEWGFRIGGFGGTRRRAALTHVPLIMVHGNNVDAGDWYPVRDDLRAAGWKDQELYALSYNGLGGQNGTALMRANPERDADHANGDGITRVTEDDVNVADLYGFITAVQAYTGQAHFSIAAHSLGVTLARETLRVHPELRADLVGFVGIAGANQGTTFCPPGSEGNVVSCDEIAAGTPWLARLNAAGQTYGPARWLTVYDGTGAGDPAYVGPTYASSPALSGAENRTYPGTYHNDLRIDSSIVADYRTWLEAVEKPYLAGLRVSSAAVSAAPGVPTALAAPPRTRTVRSSVHRVRPVPAGSVSLAATGWGASGLAIPLLVLAGMLRRRIRGCAAR